MPQRYGRCETYEARQISLQDWRLVLWRRGMLTDVVSEELEDGNYGRTPNTVPQPPLHAGDPPPSTAVP